MNGWTVLIDFREVKSPKQKTSSKTVQAIYLINHSMRDLKCAQAPGLSTVRLK